MCHGLRNAAVNTHAIRGSGHLGVGSMVGGILLGVISGVGSSASSVVTTRVHAESTGISSSVDCRILVQMWIVGHWATVHALLHNVTLAIGCKKRQEDTAHVKK